MAQTNMTGLRRARLLAGKFGLAGTAPVAAACVALVLLVATVGILVANAQTGVAVARGTDDQAHMTVQAENDNGQAPAEQPAQPAIVVVHIDGAVANPGVYTLELAQPRINDVVVLAGGLTPEADTSGVNLASVVADGTKVHIPVQGEGASVPPPDEAVGVPQQSTPATEPADDRVDLNTATAAELQTLPGVGQATAAAIVEDRERNGAFQSCEDLMRVSGIGEKKFAKLKDRVRVS